MDTKAKKLDWGDLRRTRPVSREFGYNRGQPIDRYYIDNFLARFATDIQGRVLEIGDASYTRQYGQDRVTCSDVLHVTEGNPAATIVGSLTEAHDIPSDAFDCMILTQTLHLIFDVHAALRTVYRILKPGGVVLATFPGISQISSDQWADRWCWSFSTAVARRMFETHFPSSHYTLEAFGNAFIATAFLQGLSTAEVSQDELDFRDPRYDLLLAIRATKPNSL